MSQRKRRKTVTENPMTGAILAANLERLGYSDRVFHTGIIAKKIKENTSRTMSRQRVAQLLNSENIRPTTIATIAKGLGVDYAELIKRPETAANVTETIASNGVSCGTQPVDGSVRD